MTTVYEAEAVFNSADALADEATHEVQEVRTLVATGRATEGQLSKAVSAASRANERRLTAQSGIDAARAEQRASDLAERQRDDALRAALTREAQVVFMRRCRDTLAFLAETENKLIRLGEDFDNIRPLVGSDIPVWPTTHRAWVGILQAIPPLKEHLVFESTKRLPALGIRDEAAQPTEEPKS
jgi:hypothetical protein